MVALLAKSVLNSGTPARNFSARFVVLESWAFAFTDWYHMQASHTHTGIACLILVHLFCHLLETGLKISEFSG